MAQPASTRTQVGVADLNGARLRYEIAGEGPSVVLIHSGITDSRSWEPQLAEFPRRYRVLCYDLRGSDSRMSRRERIRISRICAS